MQCEFELLIIHFSIIIVVVIVLSVKVDSLWCLMIRGLQQKELQSRCRQKAWQFFAQPFCHHHQCFCTWYHSSNCNEPNKLEHATCVLVTTSCGKVCEFSIWLKDNWKGYFDVWDSEQRKKFSKNMSSQKHIFLVIWSFSMKCCSFEA